MSAYHLSPPFRVSEMMFGHWVPQALYAAAVLGVAEVMGREPKPSDAIAAEVGANPSTLYRLLRALVVLGVCEETEAGFRLGPLGQCLRKDAPDTVRSWVLLMGGDAAHGWSQLVDCVRTGDTVWKSEGTDAFTWFQDHPDVAAIFNQAMQESSKRTARAVADAYDFSWARSMVDVGGGHGTVLVTILEAHPEMRGLILDLAYCREGATRLIQEKNLADRAEFQEGDFFAGIPSGRDIYLLKSVIHDWDDDKSLAILRNCRDAMGTRGRLLVLEPVVPDRLGLSPFDNIVVASDLNMMLNTGGRERTESEFRKLFDEAGLRLEKIHATASAMRILETRRG